MRLPLFSGVYPKLDTPKTLKPNTAFKMGNCFQLSPVTKFKGTFTLMYLDGIKQPSNSGKPLCVWIRGHFNGLTTGSLSRKNINSLHAHLPLRSLTKHLIVRIDVKLAPCGFRRVFMLFRDKCCKGNFALRSFTK